ncbi:transglycosylase SLT domain-containing protein [Asticcacaulis excentricus]|uniref:Soluble lytic murein transglycosylase n=1 Tax=Asticcacaulis excentricus TaxID=78587 RepID=A0A3G9G4D8_9CAUL|nr:transglycosylase SLT domain-containing protein [Asticcacaulis excentricus]BBF79923.1 soluble lytic murein transglycosylase precursor [Asticcacaulis excentricus]
MPLPGYIDGPVTDQSEADRQAALTPATQRDVRGVMFTGGEVGSLTGLTGGFLGQVWDQARGQNQRMLTPAEANSRYGIDGELSFTGPVTESDAAYKHRNKRDEIYRRDVLSRNDSVGGLEGFALSLTGGMVDPAGMVVNLIPVAGEARMAGTVGKAGLATRVARGGWAGFKGGALSGGLTYGLSSYAGRDYGPEDAAIDILGGTILGGGIEGLSYGYGALRRATRPNYSDAAFDALIHRESRGQQFGADGQPLRSPKGAIGVAQVMPGTAPEAARLAGLPFDEVKYKTDPDYNRALGRAYFDKQLETFGGDVDKAWAAYNAGPGRVQKAMNTHGADWLSAMPKETRDYVAANRARMAENGYEADVPAMPETPMARPRAPLPVQALDAIDQAGATAKAIGDFADDGRVDVAELVLKAADRPRAARSLDEAGVDLQIPARVYDADVAATVRGTNIPVRFAVVEARDLMTSHDDELSRNLMYPEEMQPRERDRAGSQARLQRMEREFNPLRLLTSREAEGGAPIIAPDGTVESGNGRTIVIRRGYAKGADYAAKYRQALIDSGFDVKGMEAPVLVRVRTQPMDGPQRVRLSREMNADTSERMGVTEQAFVDAEAMRAEDIGLYQGGLITRTQNDAFARRFLERAGAGQENDLIDPQTKRLSQAGIERMQAGMVAKAFGDRDLVFSIFETGNPMMKALGNALSDVASTWAKMRSMAQAGELTPGADTTEALKEALAFVRHVRDQRLNMAETIEKWADQPVLFGGDALSPEARDYLDLFFKDKDYRVQRRADDIAADLKDLAEAAMARTGGVDLLGDVPDFDVKAQIEVLRAKAVRNGRDGVEQFADEGGGPEGNGRWFSADRPAPGENAGPGLIPDAGQGGGKAAEGTGGTTEPGNATAAEKPIRPYVPQDDETRTLMAEVDALRAETALTPEPIDNPDLLAEAVRAAAFCVSQGIV